MTLEGALATAVSALAGVVGTLALWFKLQFDAIVKKLDACETDRLELWETLAENGIMKHEMPVRKSRRNNREDGG